VLISYLKPLRFFNDIYFFGSVRFFFSVGQGGVKLGKYNISEIVGFTGLKIVFNFFALDAFYLGFALDVQGKP
jgi:hypothetical protein